MGKVGRLGFSGAAAREKRREWGAAPGRKASIECSERPSGPCVELKGVILSEMYL